MNQKTRTNSSFFVWPLAIFTALSLGVHAQDEGSFDQGLEVDPGVYNSERIDIDGIFSPPKRETHADRARQERRKLMRAIEEGMEQKVEEQRFKQEKEIAGRLRRNLEKVLSGDADKAPAPKSVAKKPVPTRAQSILNNQVSFVFGAKHYAESEGVLNLDGSANKFGIGLDAQMGDNFSFGVEVGRSTMAASYEDNWGFSGLGLGLGYPLSYNSARVDYDSWDLAMKGKFYISSFTRVRIRPYFGLLVGANRSSLEFVNEAEIYGYAYPNYDYGRDNKVSGVNVRGAALAGAEINVARNVGLGLDFRYSKLLKSGFDTTPNNNRARTYDYRRDFLNSVGDEIENLDVWGINLSIALLF